MSKKHQNFNKALQNAKNVAAANASKKAKVKMKFNEDKFYTSQSVPHFEAGKVYEVEGQDMIDRWLKRGGIIVTDEVAVDAEPPKSPEPPKVEAKEPALDTDEKEPVEPSEEKAEDEAKPKSQSPDKPQADGKNK